MYKFSNHVVHTRMKLVRRKLTDRSTPSIIILQRQQRGYAKKPNDPTGPDPCIADPVKKSNKLFWGMVGAGVLTGAVVVYARNSPDARNWIESNAPWANKILALAYQEKTTYGEYTKSQIQNAALGIRDFVFGKQGVTPMEIKPRAEQDLEEDAEKFFAPKSYPLPTPILEPLYVGEKVQGPIEVETEALLVTTEKCDPPPAPYTSVSKDLVDLEQCMHENTKVAIDNYQKATEYAAEYNKALSRVIEAPVEDLDKNMFVALSGAQSKRDKAYEVARKAGTESRCCIETLDRMIKSGVKAPPESLAATMRHLNQFREDISKVEKAYQKLIDESALSEKYWSKVENARTMYKDQLECLFPGINLCAQRLEMKGDIDLLLLYTLKQIQFLQNEIAKLQTIKEVKINRAIECHDEKAIIEAKVEDMLLNETLKQEQEFLKKSLEIQAEANRNTKAQLKKQYEMQQDVLQSKLQQKEKQIMGTFSRAVSQRIQEDKLRFKKELAAMSGKLEAIEQTLKKRAAAEAGARRSQSLWAAAEALLAATRRSEPETKIDNELKALARAGQHDELVQTILKGIPKDVHENGIIPEKALKDLFYVMEKNATKVALIGREGASLPVYFLSWVQSKLLFQRFIEIPEEELSNKPTDFTKLDTFDIMHRARYYMNQGDVSVALRYLNLLQGAPRAAARPWVDAARQFLEVRQAAEAVMSHASVSGLLHL